MPRFWTTRRAAGRRPVTEDEADDVWFGVREFVPNHGPERRGRYLMRGLTRAGRSITVVLLPTPDSTAWLFYTAW
jgi:hypothetical protein